MAFHWLAVQLTNTEFNVIFLSNTSPWIIVEMTRIDIIQCHLVAKCCNYLIGYCYDSWQWNNLAPPQCYAGIILWMCPASERWCYIVTPLLIGWVHIQNDSWLWLACLGLNKVADISHVNENVLIWNKMSEMYFMDFFWCCKILGKWKCEIITNEQSSMDFKIVQFYSPSMFSIFS